MDEAVALTIVSLRVHAVGKQFLPLADRERVDFLETRICPFYSAKLPGEFGRVHAAWLSLCAARAVSASKTFFYLSRMCVFPIDAEHFLLVKVAERSLTKAQECRDVAVLFACRLCRTGERVLEHMSIRSHHPMHSKGYMRTIACCCPR